MWLGKKGPLPYSTERFRVGMFVRLKTGSPLMTVSAVYVDGLDCVWYCPDTYKFRVLQVGNPDILNIEE